MSGTVEQLCTYPIKGLSAQHLDSVALTEARGFPLDRAFAFARHGSGMDPAKPVPMPKSRFHVLARDAELARLATTFDAETQTLSVTEGETSFVFDCSDTDGQAQASNFIAGAVDINADEAPTFINGGDIRFTDVCMTSPQYMHAVSIINLASVRDLADKIGRDVDPARFRGNIIVDGWAPFSELEALDQEVSIGGARLRILKRTQRCPATQVNLQTAQRDLDIPALLDEHFGHRDMGVYAEIIGAGTISLGDSIRAL